MLVLQTFADLASHVQTVRLGEADYTLQLDWREHLGAWYATLATVAGVAVVTGVRLEAGADLLRLSDPAIAPPGQLLCVNASGMGTPATRSTVTLRFSGAGFGVIPAGALVSDGTQQWIVTASVTKVAGVAINTTASPEAFGPIAAPVATITTVVSGVPINVTVSNPAPATLGAYRVPMLQADLGVGCLIMYVAPEDLPPSEPLSWTAGTAYAFSAALEPSSPNGWRYRCTVAGTSGTREPTWPRSLGSTVADGSCTWEAAKLSDDPVSIT